MQPEVYSHAIYAALVAYSVYYIFFLSTIVTSVSDPGPDSTESLDTGRQNDPQKRQENFISLSAGCSL